ncbi:hypothetical protein GCM10022408_10290 [Hymenobacter fastidiosus]|uniref:Uncharacterized protein n=1 Tax=Hymenobacter fastidiosus TaxID=486264 RepID=A0ABP7RRI9_9BACT
MPVPAAAGNGSRHLYPRTWNPVCSAGAFSGQGRTSERSSGKLDHPGFRRRRRRNRQKIPGSGPGAPGIPPSRRNQFSLRTTDARRLHHDGQIFNRPGPLGHRQRLTSPTLPVPLTRAPGTYRLPWPAPAWAIG